MPYGRNQLGRGSPKLLPNQNIALAGVLFRVWPCKGTATLTSLASEVTSQATVALYQGLFQAYLCAS